MKKRKAVLVVLVSLLLEVAIVSPLLSSIVASQDEEEIFIMAYPSDVGEMNPLFFRSERTHWFTIQIYDSLVAYDTNLDPIPWLAESWDALLMAKTLRFTYEKALNGMTANP